MHFGKYLIFWVILMTAGVPYLLFFSVVSAAPPIDKAPVAVDFNDVVGPKETVPSADDTRVLRIAVAAMISPKHTYHHYVALLELIGDRMDREVRFVQKKTYRMVNRMLEAGELDLAFICSGPYVSGKQAFGLEILAVPVCHGKTVYHSDFIVHQASPFAAFKDLRGKVFAFTDPLSNTGCLVPTYYLARRNETPDSFFGSTFFTHSHDNSIQAVAAGFADGAAVDSLILAFMRKTDPNMVANIRVIESSPPYGIPPVVIPPSIAPDLRTQLRNLFFSIHTYPEARPLLDNLMIDRFVAGDDAAYASVRELQEYLRSRERRNQDNPP